MGHSLAWIRLSDAHRYAISRHIAARTILCEERQCSASCGLYFDQICLIQRQDDTTDIGASKNGNCRVGAAHHEGRVDVQISLDNDSRTRGEGRIDRCKSTLNNDSRVLGGVEIRSNHAIVGCPTVRRAIKGGIGRRARARRRGVRHWQQRAQRGLAVQPN